MSNSNDKQYLDFLQRLSANYLAKTAGRPVFTTNSDKNVVWDRYLSSFPAASRQFHNCMTCRSFLNHYAGLATIDEKGKVHPALWDAQITLEVDDQQKAIERLAVLVAESKVSGVFYSSEPMFGQRMHGGWTHLSVENPSIFKSTRVSASQAMAERREEYKTIIRALKEYQPAVVTKALELLQPGQLFRGEVVIDRVQWFANLQTSLAGAASPERRGNLVWLAIATAPPGFAHIRGSVLDSLFEDIAGGLSFEPIAKRFGAKMDEYQRSQKAPSAGQIDAAERAVEQLGIAPAFERRYTVSNDLDVDGVLWCPSPYAVAAQMAEQKQAKTGVFDSLRPKLDQSVPSVVAPPRRVTWEKFSRDVLPGAAVIEYRVPQYGRFSSLTTAVNLEAPPILAWDHADRRNPVAWNFTSEPVQAEDWNLVPGSLARVSNIVETPNAWRSREYSHHSKGVFLLLDGARDIRGLSGGGLFVEHLRSDLKPYRVTIEAHMNKMQVQGAADPDTVAFGVGLLAGNDWSEQAAPIQQASAAQPTAKAPDRVHVLLVMDDSVSMASYIEAARTAMRSLLNAVKEMPGRVDVTVIKFGNEVYVLAERVPLSEIDNITRQMNGNSGSTALNDAIGEAFDLADNWKKSADESFFLGIVTDGEENKSKRYTMPDIRARVTRALETGKWTVTMAGAGSDPWGNYASRIGVPEGNFKKFAASSRGFQEVGGQYADSTRTLASAYRTGARASTSFFSAVSGRHAIGKDLPVLVVTNKSGTKATYELDRWD